MVAKWSQAHYGKFSKDRTKEAGYESIFYTWKKRHCTGIVWHVHGVLLEGSVCRPVRVADSLNYSSLSMIAYVLLTRIAHGVLSDTYFVLAGSRRFHVPCIWRYRWICEYIAELEVTVACYGWYSFHRRYSSGYITPSPSRHSLLGGSFALSVIFLLGIQTSANAVHCPVFRMLMLHHFSTIHNVFVFGRPLRFSVLYLPIVPHVLSSLEWVLVILSCS